jgi:hypothetical protein
MQQSTRVIAVDWSGRSKGEGPYIWQAEHRDGTLVGIRGGREGRGRTIERLIRQAERSPRLVVGLDFGFSMPAWFLRSRGVDSAHALWRLVEAEGESWLDMCEPPFWGRAGKRRPQAPDTHHFRRTEREVRALRLPAKSIFQIAGAGAVGTGSVEIYPRAFTAAVPKSREPDRRSHLDRLEGIPSGLRALAAASPDAFDAALSAIEMGRHLHQLEALDGASDPKYGLEGRIWLPARASEADARSPPSGGGAR